LNSVTFRRTNLKLLISQIPSGLSRLTWWKICVPGELGNWSIKRSDKLHVLGLSLLSDTFIWV